MTSHYYLYGRHAVTAALENPKRRKLELLYTDAALLHDLPHLPHALQQVTAKLLERSVGSDAVHQGLALKVQPLPALDIEEWLESDCPPAPEPVCLVVLDHVRDPHNIGAILRSAAAFGAAGILLTRDHAPQENAVIAKIASGALERVPLLRTTNLARGLDLLKKQDIWCVGFDGTADKALHELPHFLRIACVFGAEGEGLRPNTRKHTDLLTRIPISGMESLNVSNAVAVGLYAFTQKNSVANPS